jgi:hypothetical protein
VVRDLLGTFPGADLQALVVWIPMVEGDDEASARLAGARLKDPRVAQVYDGERRLGRLFSSTLGLSRTAWDVYLLYQGSARWSGDSPPAPETWMHQLYDGPPERVLDPARLREKLGEMLTERDPLSFPLASLAPVP